MTDKKSTALKDKIKEGEKPHADHIISGLIHNGQFRVALVDATDTVIEAQKRHSLDPLTTIALGRALVCAALAGSSFKNQFEYISLGFEGDGPMKSVHAEFIAPSSLRGFVGVPQLSTVISPKGPVPEFVGEALGSGTLTVRKALKQGLPYTGVCEIRSGEIAEDLAHYYLESEQIPTSVISGVQLDNQGNVRSAAGLLIQKMGSIVDSDSTEILDLMEEKLKNNIAISKHVATGKSIQTIATEVFGADNVEILDKRPVGFRCFCSRERMMLGLLKLDSNELRNIEKEQNKIETVCHYCGEKYFFSANEFEKH